VLRPKHDDPARWAGPLRCILGPLTEEYLRRALLISRGDPTIFIRRPISATMLAVAVLAMAAVLAPAVSKTRQAAFESEPGDH